MKNGRWCMKLKQIEFRTQRPGKEWNSSTFTRVNSILENLGWNQKDEDTSEFLKANHYFTASFTNRIYCSRGWMMSSTGILRKIWRDAKNFLLNRLVYDVWKWKDCGFIEWRKYWQTRKNMCRGGNPAWAKCRISNSWDQYLGSVYQQYLELPQYYYSDSLLIGSRGRILTVSWATTTIL